MGFVRRVLHFQFSKISFSVRYSAQRSSLRTWFVASLPYGSMHRFVVYMCTCVHVYALGHMRGVSLVMFSFICVEPGRVVYSTPQLHVSVRSFNVRVHVNVCFFVFVCLRVRMCLCGTIVCAVMCMCVGMCLCNACVLIYLYVHGCARVYTLVYVRLWLLLCTRVRAREYLLMWLCVSYERRYVLV